MVNCFSKCSLWHECIERLRGFSYSMGIKMKRKRRRKTKTSELYLRIYFSKLDFKVQLKDASNSKIVWCELMRRIFWGNWDILSKLSTRSNIPINFLEFIGIFPTVYDYNNFMRYKLLLISILHKYLKK